MRIIRCMAALILLQYVFAKPLDIVAGKSGEQQVKEALDRAEKESELAAKEKAKGNSNQKEKEDTENFLNSLDKDLDKDAETSKSTRSSTDLKATLDKKVEELAKFHEKHGKAASIVTSSVTALTAGAQSADSNKLKIMSELIKHEKESALESLKSAESKEKENAVLEEESDKKMVEMAKKLNNLVVKFQKKMGRLSHRPKDVENLLPEKEDNGESTVKSIRGKPATLAPPDLAALIANFHAKENHHPLVDLSGLRTALGLTHTKSIKSADDANAKSSYKEDTKLEDRLAMEAEEEKKFSSGDTYGDETEDESKTSSSSSSSAASTLSPKEQASQEMQNYNALISSESNRELSQIQDEITKATQSSMGQVSVVGQKEQVNTEAPGLPGLTDLTDSSFSMGGGGGGGGGGFDTSSLSGNGGSFGNFGGNSQSDFSSSLQGLSSGGLGSMEVSAATGSEVSTQPTTTMTGGQMSGNSGASYGDQAPIEIGGSQQPVEMGTMGAGQNPFQGSQSNSLDGLQLDQSQQSFMTQGSQQPIEIGGQMGGGEQQQSMAFKKSKISNSKQVKVKVSSKPPKTRTSKHRHNRRLNKKKVNAKNE